MKKKINLTKKFNEKETAPKTRSDKIQCDVFFILYMMVFIYILLWN